MIILENINIQKLKKSLFLLDFDKLKMIDKINGCVIIPTYNNVRTLERVINGVLDLVPGKNVIVVNDGCTDGSELILSKYEDLVYLIKNDTNRGKGYSLNRGLKKAIELGFENAITIDSDGQHFPNDILVIIHAAIDNPDSVIMGSRNMSQEGVPSKSSFGNKFSNFWFKLETTQSLPDTQTGFRLYPLKPLKGMKFFTTKFEYEIEIIVRLAWKNIQFVPVSIQVLYDKEERVSHFRPGKDFLRISILNTVLVFFAAFYFYPKIFFSKKLIKIIKDEAIKSNESNFMKSISIGFGFFMGIIPLWGFQLLIGIPLSILFRMNKVLFITAANISIPPMIPLIIYSSLVFGQLFFEGNINNQKIFSFTLESIKENSIQYVVGACLLAISTGLVGFLTSFGLFSIFRKEKN